MEGRRKPGVYEPSDGVRVTHLRRMALKVLMSLSVSLSLRAAKTVQRRCEKQKQPPNGHSAVRRPEGEPGFQSAASWTSAAALLQTCGPALRAIRRS